MFDVGPPLGLIAIGLILWLAVSTTVAGFSIQTIGLILFMTGVAWLVIELTMGRILARPAREQTVVREREVR